jgi:hypothetical protein
MPKRIGGYTITRFIGAGGAGEVYAARDDALERDVAIKVLKGEVAQDKTRRERFMREGKMMARIRSPHVAAIYAVGEHEGMPFLVMELLDGDDLENVLRKRGAMSVQGALSAVRQACLGLDAAAGLDVIHRDVKPANIVLGSGGVKLTDFGLARPQDGSAQVTTEGLVTGTPAFLAPERAMGKGDDHRSDIYSLGATLYTLLAGQPPFVRETPIEVITAQLKEEPAKLEKVAADVDRHVGHLVRKMMRKDPARRYQTYADVVSDIDLCLMSREDDADLTVVNDPFNAPTSSVRSAVGAPTGVMGSLKQMRVNDIVQMLEIGRKTATVDVEPAGAGRGGLGVVGGQVVYAVLGSLTGDEAFYTLCRMEEGSFRIRYGREPSEQNITAPTQLLMLEAMRRIDEGTARAPAPAISADPSDAPPPPRPRIAGAPERPSDGHAAPALPDAPHTAPQPVTPHAPTVLSALDPGADVGTLADLPDAAPPPLGDDDDPLQPRDTLIVKHEDSEEEDTNTAPHDRAKTVRMQTQADEFLDRTEAMPGPYLDSEEGPDLDGGPTEESDPRAEFADVTAPQRVIPSDTRHTPETVSGIGAPSFDDVPPTDHVARDRPAPVDLDDTRPASAVFDKAPWLASVDAALLGAAQRVQRQPWLLGLLIFPLLALTVALAVATMSATGQPSLARIDAGEAKAVLAELDALGTDGRTAKQDLLRAHALIALDRPEEATVALQEAIDGGARDKRALDFLIDQLDDVSAGPAVDVLVAWRGKTVTHALVAQTEREDYVPRKHAVTALVERDEADAYDRFGVALKDLRDAPTCGERKTALTYVNKVIRTVGKEKTQQARDAVEAAASRSGNDCMQQLFKRMLPHRYR